MKSVITNNLYDQNFDKVEPMTLKEFRKEFDDLLNQQQIITWKEDAEKYRAKENRFGNTLSLKEIDAEIERYSKMEAEIKELKEELERAKTWGKNVIEKNRDEIKTLKEELEIRTCERDGFIIMKNDFSKQIEKYQKLVGDIESMMKNGITNKMNLKKLIGELEK